VSSSAILNGGLVYADHIVNILVSKCLAAPNLPQITLTDYCGKHVLFGEILGRMVTETVIFSITWDIKNNRFR
jgi:adenosylcobinamide amidohydrolase